MLMEMMVLAIGGETEELLHDSGRIEGTLPHLYDLVLQWRVRVQGLGLNRGPHASDSCQDWVIKGRRNLVRIET